MKGDLQVLENAPKEKVFGRAQGSGVECKAGLRVDTNLTDEISQVDMTIGKTGVMGSSG